LRVARFGIVRIGERHSAIPVPVFLGSVCYLMDGESGRHATSGTIVVAHGVFVPLYYANSTVPSWGRVGGKADQSLQGEICLAFPKLEISSGSVIELPRLGKEGASYPLCAFKVDG